jgi:hypothetical protein
MPVEHTGGCVCGSVRFRATGEPLRVTICHCMWCQRRTGTAFGTEVVFNRDQVEITGQDVTRYRHISDESGRWLDIEAAPEVRTLPAGTFDDPAWIRPDRCKVRHVYLRSRREWSDLSPMVEAYDHHFRK